MVSQRERLEDIQNYAETLEELKFNSKPHISTLTELARDYGKNRQGREVIEIIKKRIVNKETPITQKMPTLYLLDSILKNHPDNYKQHIEEILASVFEVTFSSGDEKIRMAMYKLRQTWTPWFQYKTLYDLDMRTKKLDKAWPVIENPSKSGSGSDLPTASKPKDIKRQTSNIHVNPNFVARAPSVSEDSQNEDDELKAMEEKIKEMQEKQKRKKAQIEKDRKRKELEALLEKERMELEVERELKETELPKISTSGSKSKDSSHNSSSTSSSSSSSKASTSKVCIMVKAC